MRAAVIASLGVAAIAVVTLTTTIERGPELHRYADTRRWLGIPNAGDVLSNLAFVAVALWGWRERRRMTGPDGTTALLAHLVIAHVAAIGVGSAAYHASPGDLRLAFDWLPIVITLGLLSAAVVHDRDPRAGRVALVIAPLVAIGAVAWWLATGGTRGGNLAPYVATQAVGVALPPLVALAAPGAIRARWLLLGVAGFALARMLAAHDRALLDAIGVSGHSLKHCAAAMAAACALRALMRR